MNVKIFQVLEVSQIKNDPSLPYWIYHIELVQVCGKKFFKVYLFNKEFDDKKLNFITFEHLDKEYQFANFDVVSEFKDQNIVGVAFETTIDDFNIDIRIIREIVDGREYGSSQLLDNYIRSIEPVEKSYLISKMPQYAKHHEIYPQITKTYWQCSCGRIHSNNTINCYCGLTINDINDILNFNFEENHIQDYLNKSIGYDLNKSFEQNIDDYKLQFKTSFGINPEKLIERINLGAEEEKYNELYEERNKQLIEEKIRKQKLEEKAKIAAKKRKKKFTIVSLLVCICVLFAIVLNVVVIPKIEYNSLVEKYGQEYVDTFRSLNVGDTFVFGTYEQDNDLSNGPESIEWIVLEKKGNKILLISDKALDCHQYSNNRYTASARWEDCSLRMWLNNIFVNKAFSADERSQILPIKNSEDNNSNSYNVTQDEVFLLSSTEVKNYFPSSIERQCKPTSYAMAQGVYADERNNCRWWLRKDATSSLIFEFVNCIGEINSFSSYRTLEAVRPVIWVGLDF